LLRIECTDPLACIDIPHFIAGTSHKLEDQTHDENTIVFFVRRA
jgi:TusA-related sulfurtransferase